MFLYFTRRDIERRSEDTSGPESPLSLLALAEAGAWPPAQRVGCDVLRKDERLAAAGGSRRRREIGEMQSVSPRCSGISDQTSAS